jgi:hypothetical protein
VERMRTALGRHNEGILDVRYPRILKAPPQSAMAPPSTKVDPGDIMKEWGSNPENHADMIAHIGWGTNPAAGISFSSSPSSIMRPRREGEARGPFRQEPFSVLPSGNGLYQTDDERLPQEFYDLTKLRPDYSPYDAKEDRSEFFGTPYPWLQGNEMKAQRSAFRTSVQPTATYDVEVQTIPAISRAVVYKIFTTISPMSEMDFSELLPNLQTKVVRSRNFSQYLTPIFSTFLKVGDNKIPITFRDPNRVIMQAQLEQPIEIPLPRMGQDPRARLGTSVQTALESDTSGLQEQPTLKLQNYIVTVVQPNVNAPSEVIFEVAPQLKDRPDVKTALNQIESAYHIVAHQEKVAGPGKLSTQVVSPLATQQYNYYATHVQGLPVKPSHIYTTVSNGFELIPESDQLGAVRTSLAERPRTVALPQAVGEYPFF